MWLRDEFREATLDFVAGYTPLRENAMVEWREAARYMNGSAERLIATIEQSFPPAAQMDLALSCAAMLGNDRL